MLSDPQSLVVNTHTLTLPAISRGADASVYNFQDAANVTTLGVQGYKFTVSHQLRTRNRLSVRLDVTGFTTSQLDSTTNVPISSSVYLVIDTPSERYYTDTALGAFVTALADWLKAGSNTANVLAFQT